MMNREKLVITGAGGFLGRGLRQVLEQHYDLRLVDIHAFETDHECCIGDVADPAFCDRVLDGAQLLLIAHMSPRPCDVPFGPFNANVTGTANLLHAAAMHGVRRACVISSVDAVRWEVISNGKKHEPSLRPSAVDIYSATKACQEIAAEALHRQFGMSTAVLRIGYVVDCARLVNKYGTQLTATAGGMIDPEDCGNAVHRVFEQPEFGYRVWYIYSVSDDATAEGYPAREELNWHPKYQEQQEVVL